MLNEATLKLLKVHNIDPETVSYVDENMLVTFKDDTQRRICEVYSRVMGYIRPSTEYNVGKMGEFKSRKCFEEEKAVKRMETITAEEPQEPQETEN